MAIDTTNEKLALLEWDNVWEPGLPMSPGSLGQNDKQQLLWGYPGILWASPPTPLVVATLVTQPATGSFAITPRYEIWLGNQTGVRQSLIDEFESLNITLPLNRPGALNLPFPAVINNNEFDYNLLIEDAWVEVWRGVNDLPMRLVGETVHLLDQERIDIGEAGKKTITIFGSSAARVFEWPIVAYDAGTSQSGKTDFADDMIKEIAAENVGASATDTDRDMSAHLSIEADAGAGPSITKSFARRQLSRVFTDICDQSEANDTRLYWDVVLSSPGDTANRTLELRTYTDHRGTNRGLDVDNTLVFSVGRGNLQSISRERDYTDVVNYGYGLGQGIQSARNVQPASDAARIASSPWGRIKEGTRQASHGTSDASVTAEAESLIQEKKPREIWQGTVTQTPSSIFGYHWNNGDIVVIEAFGQRKEAIITPVQIRYQNGQETITASFKTI